MSTTGDAEQLSLLRAAVRPTRTPPSGVAETLPVARVAVDVPLAHLDRPFDYLVPATMDAEVRAGSRVQVRFAGRRVGGLVLERVERSEHDGRLERLARAVSPEVVLRPDVARLVRRVADRYAGTFADVVRLAVPPRHARAEGRERGARAAAGEVSAPACPFDDQEGLRWWDALAAGSGARAVWTAPPSADVHRTVARAVATVLAGGRGAVVCVPDTHDVAQFDVALGDVLGRGRHVVLTADLGPQARYSAFLSLSRGEVQAVVGTRAAAFAPVHDLGLVVVWDDGDDLHAEPRAPSPHAREVLLTRAADTGAAALVAAHARSCEAQRLVETGWAVAIGPDAVARRRSWPRVQVAGADERSAQRDAAARTARLPVDALQAVRAGLERGPVLVQVPRAGYRAALACRTCRVAARCPRCHGPLAQDAADAPPGCRWCGHAVPDWTCSTCGGHHLRAPVVGRGRTAEELGRSFPGVPVVDTSGEHRVVRVDTRPRLVVATPGAEPVAEEGYAAAILMDAWVLLARTDLRTAEEAVRRWANAAALVVPADDGGRVVVVGDPGDPAVQALVRADPTGFAHRELEERTEARFPPAVRMAVVEGPTSVVEPLVVHAWPEPSEVLGPVPVPPEPGAGADADDPRVRLVVRTPWSRGGALVAALRELQTRRSLHKEPPLRVRVDPVSLSF